MAGRFQISAAVQEKLKEQNLTADEVLRKALHIKLEGLQASEDVFLPEGTMLLALYKERPYHGFVREGGIEMEGGKRYPSVSAAAASVTGRATTNGWDFWLVKMPGKNEFKQIKDFRK